MYFLKHSYFLLFGLFISCGSGSENNNESKDHGSVSHDSVEISNSQKFDPEETLSNLQGIWRLDEASEYPRIMPKMMNMPLKVDVEDRAILEIIDDSIFISQYKEKCSYKIELEENDLMYLNPGFSMSRTEWRIHTLNDSVLRIFLKSSFEVENFTRQ